MKRKVYVAGKITGCSTYINNFKNAQKHFEDQGYAVLNPAELPGGMTPGDYLRICMSMIDSADIIYFMPNYIDSKVQIELLYSRYVGKIVIFELIR